VLTGYNQLNQANNQQIVNNGAKESFSDNPNEKSFNHVDRGIETGRTGPNNENETMALPEREKDVRGAETLINECSQARDAVSADDRVAETVGPIESSRTGS